MKKKKRNRRKRRPPARHEARAFHTKRREKSKQVKVEPPTAPWLRIVSTVIEDDANTEVSGGLLSRRNGRHQLQDLDLYIPEDNSRSR